MPSFTALRPVTFGNSSFKVQPGETITIEGSSVRLDGVVVLGVDGHPFEGAIRGAIGLGWFVAAPDPPFDDRTPIRPVPVPVARPVPAPAAPRVRPAPVPKVRKNRIDHLLEAFDD